MGLFHHWKYIFQLIIVTLLSFANRLSVHLSEIFPRMCMIKPIIFHYLPISSTVAERVKAPGQWYIEENGRERGPEIDPCTGNLFFFHWHPKVYSNWFQIRLNISPYVHSESTVNKPFLKFTVDFWVVFDKNLVL